MKNANITTLVVNSFFFVCIWNVNAFVNFIKTLREVDIVDLRNIDSYLVSLISSRKNILQEPTVSFVEFNSKTFFKNLLKSIKENLCVFIFLVGLTLHHRHKIFPFLVA
jgi:hypothetical protein